MQLNRRMFPLTLTLSLWERGPIEHSNVTPGRGAQLTAMPWSGCKSLSR